MYFVIGYQVVTEVVLAAFIAKKTAITKLERLKYEISYKILQNMQVVLTKNLTIWHLLYYYKLRCWLHKQSSSNVTCGQSLYLSVSNGTRLSTLIFQESH